MGDIYLFRFILHLPTLYNDGRPIEPVKISAMLSEVQQRFTGYTKSPHLGPPVWEGWWRGQDGRMYRDRIYMLYIDAPDTDDVVEFFQKFRAKYSEVFEQSELYIIYHPVTKIE